MIIWKYNQLHIILVLQIMFPIYFLPRNKSYHNVYIESKKKSQGHKFNIPLNSRGMK